MRISIYVVEFLGVQKSIMFYLGIIKKKTLNMNSIISVKLTIQFPI